MSIIYTILAISTFLFIYQVSEIKQTLLHKSFDIIVYFRDEVASKTNDLIARIISLVGEIYGLGGIVYLAVLMLDDQAASFTITTAFSFSVQLVGVLKFAFAEGRPFFEDPRIHPFSCKTLEYGFPSGHSVAFTTTFANATYFFLKKYNPTNSKTISFFTYLVLGMAIILVALSRSFAGVHSYDQTIAGVIIGFILTLLFTRSATTDYLKHLRTSLMEKDDVCKLIFNRFVFVFIVPLHAIGAYQFYTAEPITE